MLDVVHVELVDLLASGQVGPGATVKELVILIDGANLQSSNGTRLTAKWDTAALSNGAHVIPATLTDSAGNTGTATPVNVTVTGGITIGAAAVAAGRRGARPERWRRSWASRSCWRRA